jgi:hypothetical protein
MMSFATVLVSLSLSDLANAQMASGEPTRAPHPKFFEQKVERQDKPDCADGKQPGEMKRLEHKQRANHAEFKAYIDNLPEAERDYIKSEFKAIREDRVANQRRMDALKERLDTYRSEMIDKISDRDGKRGNHPRDNRAIKKFNGQLGACMMKGHKPQADEDQSRKEHREQPQHRCHDANDRHIKMAE